MLYSDIQTFVLIFIETGRKRREIYISSAISTRFIHDQWISVRFVYVYI